MESLPLAFVGFLVSLAFILISIIKFKAHPFFALIMGAIIMGITSALPLPMIASEMATGFGNTMGGVGIIIIFGIIFGQILHESGSAGQIANMLLKSIGQKKAPLAMNLTGFVVSIPVFFDAAFVILVNLAKTISRKGKIPFITLVTALAVGLITTHSTVIPTPGPLAVIANMGASVPAFVAYSLGISLIASITGGVIYGTWLGKREKYRSDFANSFEDEFDALEKSEVEQTTKELPSGGLGVSLILLPILMILIGTSVGGMLEEDTFASQLVTFVGDRNIALITGTIVSYVALRKYLNKNFADIITTGAISVGPILMITGAGGAFGRIINQTAIGTGLGDVLEGLAGLGNIGFMFVLIGFAISQALRCAQGSTTVALVTTSAIMGPVIADIPHASAVLVSIAICFGGLGFSLPNDSGFWVVNRMAKLSMEDTFKSWTLGGGIAGLTALTLLIILSFFQGVLPGLL